MQTNDIPILEFDPSEESVIHPHTVNKLPIPLPERAIICYFREAIQSFLDQALIEQIATFDGEIINLPIYQTTQQNHPIVIIPGQLGSANAAKYLEHLYSNGVTKVIVIGGAGVLDPKITVGKLIIPIAAIRDEGASYHYLPPSQEVAMQPDVADLITLNLTKWQLNHIKGKTWTTDAFFRETHKKVARRKEQGAIAVEMEAATYFAVAQFRKIKLGQILYAGDDISGTDWDKRDWKNQPKIRHQLLHLSIDICSQL